jgi:hypothetical protein
LSRLPEFLYCEFFVGLAQWLQGRHQENLEELDEVLRRGRTLDGVDGVDGGWQVAMN